MALRELLALFSIELDDKALKKGHEEVEGFKDTLDKAAKAIAAAFAIHEIKDFVQSQIEAGSQLKTTAIRLGTTTQELQAMQLAAGDAGVNVDSLADGLRFLNRNIADATTKGGESAQTFAKFHIALKDSHGATRAAGDVMADLADAIARTPDAATRTQVAMQLLGRGGAALIPLLVRGRQAFEDARKGVEELGGGLSDEFIEQAHEAEAAQGRLNFAMKGFKAQVASAVLPLVTQLSHWLSRLVGDAVKLTHQTTILQTSLKFLGTIGAIKALSALKDLGKTMGFLKPSFLSTVASLMKFAGPLALLGALYLVFDDLYGFAHGKDSLIGRMLPDKDKAEILAELTELSKSLADAWNSLKPTFIDALKATVPLVTKMVELLTQAVLGLFQAAKDAGGAIGDWLGKLQDTTQKRARDEAAKYGTPEERARGASMTDEEISAAYKRQLAEQRAARAAQGQAPAPEGALLLPTIPITGTPARAVPRGAGVNGGGGGTQINQVVNNKIDVHTQPGADGEDIGAAIGPGVASATQRANERAYRAGKVP